MANKLAVEILLLFREALRAWKSFIDTRQDAYNRKQDKRKNRAINYAEQTYEKVGILFEFIYENVEIPKDKQAEYDRLKELIYKLKAKFNKYD